MRIIEIILSYWRGFWVAIRLNCFCSNCRSSILMRIGRNCRIRVRKNSGICIGRNVVIGDGVKISSLNGGNIIIGDNVGLGDYDQIVSHESVSIENGCNVAPHVYMFDHDHVVNNMGVVRNQFITKPISIGKKCWIGVNTTILKGSRIGENSVIAAGSIVLGEVEKNTVYIQKRDTIKKIIQT